MYEPSVPRPPQSYVRKRRAQEVAEFELIVVGSGLGASGLIYRISQMYAAEAMPRILWIEAGTEGVVLDWPKGLLKASDEGRVPKYKVKGKATQWARSWEAFGGGDALNSGGPTYLGMQVPRPPDLSGVDVFEMRCRSVQTPTPLGEAFINAFGEYGYEKITPLPAKTNAGWPNCVGYPASIYNRGAKSRELIADSLKGMVSLLQLETRVSAVILERGEQTRAVGIRTAAGKEYRASKGVVLAAGVFGTYDLLVDSGIGPAEALRARGREPVLVNEAVGQEVGDEVQVTCLFIPATKQGPPPPNGPWCELVGWKSASGHLAAVVWPYGLNALFPLLYRPPICTTLVTWVCCGLLKWFTRFLLALVLGPISFIGISLHTPPVRSLEIDRHGKLSGLLNTEIEVFAAENGTCYVQVVLNVTNVEFTQEMLDEYNAQLPPLKRALEINREQTEGWVQRLLRLQLRCFTPIVKALLHGVTEFDLEPRRSPQSLSSYQHFYGGCGDGVVDAATGYQVRGVDGLFVSDASVLTVGGKEMLPGAPSSTVMEQGMRVADAMIAAGVLEPPAIP